MREVGPEQTFAVDAESVLDEPGDEVLGAIRGRGLARLAKLGVMRRLAELDVTLAINERLGFRPVVTQYFYVLEGSES